MQLVNEKRTNDSVIIIIISRGTQQQRFGLRKGHPYNLSQTPNSSVTETALCHWELVCVHGMAPDLLQMQASLSSGGISCSKLRYISSLLAIVLSMLRHTFLPKKNFKPISLLQTDW